MKQKNTLIALIAVLTVALVILVAVAVLLPGKEPADPTGPNTLQTDPVGSTGTTEPSAEPTETEPTETEPKPYKVSTATVSSVGDILMHKGVFQSGYDDATGTYDLNLIFKYFTDHVSRADLALANLETTLCGTDNGYQYNGYPNFNCPDAIGTAMKNAGFDTILTANNHSYDTRHVGLIRTQEVLASQNLQYLGTKLDAEAPDYMITELNGIRVGLMCYTYETVNDYDDRISLNGTTLTPADSLLVNSFDYTDLPAFYSELEENLEEMETYGVDATILYIHWGDEYQLKPNSHQKSIAQELCDMSIDVIVGGHPHVVQPVELLTSNEDPDQKTVCLYSMGNAVSNQRLGNISNCKTAHTEDGVMFSVTFAKYSDGTVIVESAEALPIWVDLRYNANWKREYVILPLDKSIADWKTQFGLTDETLTKANESYDRTAKLVDAGITEANAWYAARQEALEAELGIGN